MSRQNGRVAAASLAPQTETVAQINAIFSSLRFLLPTFSLTFAGRFFFPPRSEEGLEYFEEGEMIYAVPFCGGPKSKHIFPVHHSSLFDSALPLTDLGTVPV